MKYSVALPRVDAGADFIEPAALRRIAQAIEVAGLDACHVTDHPAALAGKASLGRQAFDPFSVLAFVAAATTTLKLHTNILVLPYRNPFLVASAALTLHHLSGGRLVLGVGAGYFESEFAALGVSFSERNELVDEALPVIQAAWTGRPVNAVGRHWVADGNALPALERSDAPTIWVGGNSRLAMRRAVAGCDGWSPFQSPAARSALTRTGRMDGLDDLRTKIAEIKTMAEAAGRTRPLDICFLIRNAWSEAGDDLILSQAEEMAAIGVTWIAFTVEAGSVSAMVERIGALGELLSCRPMS